MTNNENEQLTTAFSCPYCKKELPEEMAFCPYCMERIKKPTVITPARKNSNKKLFWFIPLFAGLFIMTLVCVICIIFAINTKPRANVPSQTVETTSADTLSGTKNDDEKVIIGNNTQAVNGTNAEGDKETVSSSPAEPKKTEAYEETQKNNTTKTDKATKPDTIPEPTKGNKTPVTSEPATPTESTVSLAQMVGRWNKTNTDLNIYNFPLSGYTSQSNGDSHTISQYFNSSGVNIDFTFKKNLEGFTLKGDNVANLNSMYQLCRVALGTVAGSNYNDSSFYDFVSNDNWKKVNTNTESKVGTFAGYKCTLTLTTHENTDQWGLSYTRYSFTLSASKI